MSSGEWFVIGYWAGCAWASLCWYVMMRRLHQQVRDILRRS